MAPYLLIDVGKPVLSAERKSLHEFLEELPARVVDFPVLKFARNVQL